jgi:hypothetical protein
MPYDAYLSDDLNWRNIIKISRDKSFNESFVVTVNAVRVVTAIKKLKDELEPILSDKKFCYELYVADISVPVPVYFSTENEAIESRNHLLVMMENNIPY